MTEQPHNPHDPDDTEEDTAQPDVYPDEPEDNGRDSAVPLPDDLGDDSDVEPTLDEEQ